METENILTSPKASVRHHSIESHPSGGGSTKNSIEMANTSMKIRE